MSAARRSFPNLRGSPVSDLGRGDACPSRQIPNFNLTSLGAKAELVPCAEPSPKETVRIRQLLSRPCNLPLRCEIGIRDPFDLEAPSQRLKIDSDPVLHKERKGLIEWRKAHPSKHAAIQVAGFSPQQARRIHFQHEWVDLASKGEAQQ